MSFLEKLQIVEPTQQVDPLQEGTITPPTLSRIEIEMLLGTIRQTHFKGEDIERVYNLVLKLQQLYICSEPVGSI